MESKKSFKENAENDVVVLEIRASENSPARTSAGNGKSKPPSMVELSATTSRRPIQYPSSSTNIPIQIPVPSSIRRRPITTSPYSKPKSRIAELPYPAKSTLPDKTPQIPLQTSPSPKLTPKTSAPITPRTPLMASMEGDEDEDDDNEVYMTDSLETDTVKDKGKKKVRVLEVIEWIAFVSITGVLIASLTINRLREDVQIWSLELWKWSVLVMVIICGRLFAKCLTNALAFLIEKNFLLKKKVLYFLFALKKSVYLIIWLSLILLAWALLINRGVERSKEATRVLNYITRGIVSTLVGVVLWMVKTLLIKLIASSFHVRTYFDRIQESIFHQYILQTLLGPPLMAVTDGGESSSRRSGKLSFKKMSGGKERKDEEVIDVDKLYRMKREKVSAWTMGGLISVIRNSALPNVYEVIDESVEELGEPRLITSQVEAREAANRIFRNVAKEGHKYIEEDDMLRFMPKEEADNAFLLFEGAAESKRIKKSAFRNWVVKVYNERKCLALSLTDSKTAVEELNKLASALILLVIVIVWLLLMEITTTRVLVFISSQVLLVAFMFGNTAKTVFEAIIFVFIMHPFDVGDRCVVDGAQMIVDEMNILTTIFLRPDNEKVYYPNAVLATQPISNFNRSPEMMGDSVEFAVDFSTSAESIASLKAKIKEYLDSKPQHWNPSHSVQINDIVDVDKMIMALYVTHTLNFQNAVERGNRRSDLVFELKRILQELGIRYHLLPQEVQVRYFGEVSRPS